MPEEQSTKDEKNNLLRRIAERDLTAMEEFYQQTATPLFSVALRILRDAGEAEEVLQDVYVQIWQKATSFDPLLGSAFYWAMSITRNRAIDRVRARQRQARLVEELQEALPASAGNAGEPPGVHLAADEASAVRAALKSLPDEQRQALEMAFFRGQTHLEIAAALQQPLGTIKARIRRGLQKLRDELEVYA